MNEPFLQCSECTNNCLRIIYLLHVENLRGQKAFLTFFLRSESELNREV